MRHQEGEQTGNRSLTYDDGTDRQRQRPLELLGEIVFTLTEACRGGKGRGGWDKVSLGILLACGAPGVHGVAWALEFDSGSHSVVRAARCDYA